MVAGAHNFCRGLDRVVLNVGGVCLERIRRHAFGGVDYLVMRPCLMSTVPRALVVVLVVSSVIAL